MWLIKNAHIRTMAGQDYEKGDLLIRDGKIAALGQNLSQEGARVIDATGMVMLPGFVDAHCHMGIHEEGVRDEGMDYNEMSDPITPDMRAIDAIFPTDEGFREALAAGVTTVCTGPGSANVIGGTFVAMKTWGDRVDDMVFKDPLAMKAAFGENPKRVYGGQKKSPQTRMATAALLRRTLVKAQNYKDKLLRASKDPLLLPPERDLAMESMVKVIDRELPLKVHAHRADDIMTVIRIMKEFNLRYTIEHCTEGHLIADYLKEEGAQVILGPLLTSKSKIEMRNKSFEAPAMLYQKGMKFAIMTDHPVIPGQHLPLCASLAVHSGLPEEAALKAITIWAAEIVGIADRVGSLEVGKDADVTLFAGDPLDVRTRVSKVFVDGECRYEDMI